MCNDFPNDFSVSGRKYTIKKPKSVYLVKLETINEICRLIINKESCGFFLEYQKLKELSGKPEEKICQLLASEGSKEIFNGQPGYATWAHHWLIEYLKENFDITVSSGVPIVFLSPEAIITRFSYVEDYFRRVLGESPNIGELRDRTVRSVIWHELAHICFERQNKPFELRLSEGLANFFVFMLMDDLGKRVLHTLACSPEMDFRRNYYHLMRYYGPATDQIITSYFDDKRGDAFSVFRELRRYAEAYNAIETSGGGLRIGGKIIGDPWLAYGATKKNLSIAIKLPFLCNIKSGVVIAPKIGNIIGYLSEELKVITHEIEEHEYSKLPINIKIVDESELDIKRVVKEEIMKNKQSEEEIVKPYFA